MQAFRYGLPNTAHIADDGIRSKAAGQEKHQGRSGYGCKEEQSACLYGFSHSSYELFEPFEPPFASLMY
jgi:hypothetical protein